MSKGLAIAMIVLAVAAGFGGGFLYEVTLGGQKPKTAVTTTTAATTVKTAPSESLADCLKRVWGEEKYAALSATPALATAEDNFKALPCYK